MQIRRTVYFWILINRIKETKQQLLRVLKIIRNYSLIFGHARESTIKMLDLKIYPLEKKKANNG
jgi:hypothetical protein